MADTATVADAGSMILRIHAVLIRGQPREIWSMADRHTRHLWCALAHVNSEECPPMPWEQLTENQRLKLATMPAVMINFLRNLAELAGAEIG